MYRGELNHSMYILHILYQLNNVTAAAFINVKGNDSGDCYKIRTAESLLYM